MRQKSGQPRGFLGGFLSVFGTTLLLMLVALAVATVVVPVVKNGAALTVLSGSMRPNLQPGDMIVVEGVTDPAQQIKYGDVITFQPNPNDPTLVTHRVIGLTQNPVDGPGFRTQGDNNPSPDEPILAKQVRGKMLYKVPYIGYGISWIKNRAPWLITAVALSLLAYALWGVFVPKRRRGKTSSEPANDASPQSEDQSPAAASPVPAAPALTSLAALANATYPATNVAPLPTATPDQKPSPTPISALTK
ncbi:MAG: signal peptidase I [Micrococcales bacterium]|nr:signal peptidase I [Micrococcales bacterium]